MTFEIEAGGRVWIVAVEPVDGAGPAGGRFRLRLSTGAAGAAGGTTEVSDVDVTPTDAGLSLLMCATGRVVDAAVTDMGAGEYFIQLPHVELAAIVDARRHRRPGDSPAARAGEERLIAPMPGRVLRVLVQPGDEVRARQGLVVLEAMKMENEVTARRAGRVKEVLATPGESVEGGRLLVVLE
jgi:biotin carboxyl carrier protein